MKTPREILLEQHATVTPRLDAVRCAIVQELNNQETKKPSSSTLFATLLLCCSKKIWLELVWPCRRTWTGLMAVWVGLAIFNATQAEHGRTAVTQSASPVAVRLAFLEQRQMLDELIGPAMPALPAAPPHRPNNQPRSEKRVTLMTA